jgi:hypothetical protein
MEYFAGHRKVGVRNGFHHSNARDIAASLRWRRASPGETTTVAPEGPSVNSSACLSILIGLTLIAGGSAARDNNRPPIPSNNSAAASPPSNGASSLSQLVIPGSRRSFLRMAAISQQIAPEETLPLLSRNVFVHGYEGTSRETEFLVLLRRYVHQARELAALAANSDGTIRVSNCDEAAPLLHILGVRATGGCGNPNTSLRTEDPERAFVTIDSGFPLPQLEKALEAGKPFEYSVSSSPVPVLFNERDWTAAIKRPSDQGKDLLDAILDDANLARLYWALSRMDPDTSRFLQQSIGIGKLLPYAGVLDFYGREFCVRDGRVVVPGGQNAESAWKDLVGASPASPTAFIVRLLARDKGWLAAYFDALSRTNGVRTAYFTEPDRLREFYEGLRAPDPNSPATRGSFRPAPELLRIVACLRLNKSGEPLVPGNIEVWKDILFRGHDAQHIRKWAGRSRSLENPDQLVAIMFGLSRAPIESEQLQAYMAISEIDGRRPDGHHLAPATVRLLAKKFEEYRDQYPMFTEFPELSDPSIALFFDVAGKMTSTPSAMRANALGLFQANVGIWQILARQGEISPSRLDDSWQQAIKPFAMVKSSADLFDAGRVSLDELCQFSAVKSKASENVIIDLLAGPAQETSAGKLVHREVANQIRSVMDDQRLVSLDTLLTVGNALAEKARGQQPQEYVTALASQTREFQMPRPIFSNGERSEWAAGIYNNRHTDLQMKTDIPKVLKSPSSSAAQIEDARGQLASFLRDTLVGLNYAYYEPPGAQALHINPLFVRSHDFAGETLGGVKSLWQAPVILGQGTPAGGGAHFVGSLADLPYALADLEQDFISPENTQALIWRELVPTVLTAAIVPRWWNVTPIELHAIALYQRAGEELLTASERDEALRGQVMVILSRRMLPPQTWRIEQALQSDRVAEFLPQIMPADTFYLAAEYQQEFPDQFATRGNSAKELANLSREHPEQVNWSRLSQDFGTPHPSMTADYGLELLNMKPMPPMAGDASRFLAESWDSPNLYWARLLDEAGDAPVMLTTLAPELTRLMVRKIFATDLEDWAALDRAMRATGEEFQHNKLASALPEGAVRQ